MLLHAAPEKGKEEASVKADEATASVRKNSIDSAKPVERDDEMTKARLNSARIKRAAT